MPSSASAKPTNWPKTIEYLTTLRLSRTLSKQAHDTLTGPPTGAVISIKLGPCAKVRIRAVNESSHPAHGQYGLYATQHLHPDSLILTYLGFAHTEAETDPASDYDLSLDRDHGIGVDAMRMGNEARFINDYRGVASAPNAEFREVWIDIGGGRAEKRIGVYVLSAGKSGKRSKGIGKGQEILISYGKGFWSERVAAVDGAP